jgi:hypothetical protein
MHILFKDDMPLISRRLLNVMRNEAFKSHEAELQATVAQELKLPISKVAVKSYLEKDYMHDRGGRNIWHTELRFKGLEAIALGYKLEKAVLANTFHPIPSHPIHRLYMEEIFDCGAHAVGATHTYDGLNDKKANIKFSLPDEGWEKKSISSPTRATPAPTDGCSYTLHANTNVPHVLCNRGNSYAQAMQSGCAFATYSEAVLACDSPTWSSTCEAIVKDGFGYNLRGQSAKRSPGAWRGVNSWWRTCNGVSKVTSR